MVLINLGDSCVVIADSYTRMTYLREMVFFLQVIVTAPMEMLKIYGQDAGRINALSGKYSLAVNAFPLPRFVAKI